MVIPRIPAVLVFWGFLLFFAAAFVLSTVLCRKVIMRLNRAKPARINRA
jgi:hypothetical protein